MAEPSASLPVYSPMLASRWPAAFTDPEWAFEVKWDGVRAVAAWNGERLDVRSRTGRPIGPNYPELDQLAGLAPCVLDGEIVAFDDEGRPSFGRLQQRQSLPTPISFMVFDLLFLGGPLVDQPWTVRRERLAALQLPVPYVVPDPVIGEGHALWEGVVEQGLEGAINRKPRSRPGNQKFDGRHQAHLSALACADAPEGRSKWTLQLLADHLVQLEQAESISVSSVRRLLKKTP